MNLEQFLNKETWAIYVEATSPENLDYWLQNADRCIHSVAPRGDDIPHIELKARYLLEDLLESHFSDEIESLSDPLPSLVSDLLQHALSRIDWRSIAERLFEALKQNVTA